MPGSGYDMNPDAVDAAGTRLHSVGDGFDQQWKAAAAQINALQAQLGKGRLGAAAVPKLHEASGKIGPTADALGGRVSRLGTGVRDSATSYRDTDASAAASMPR